MQETPAEQGVRAGLRPGGGARVRGPQRPQSPALSAGARLRLPAPRITEEARPMCFQSICMSPIKMQFCKNASVSKQQLEPFYGTFNHHLQPNLQTPQPGSQDLPRENEIKVGATLRAPTSRGSVDGALTPFTPGQPIWLHALLPLAPGVLPPLPYPPSLAPSPRPSCLHQGPSFDP